MSDDAVPPPPPGGTPPPPPPPPGPPPAWSTHGPPPVSPPPFGPLGTPEQSKPPRPKVRVGAILVMVGAAIGSLGTFLPWARLGDETGNGFDFYRFRDNLDVIEVDAPGAVVLVFSAGLIGFGLALLLAGRVLAMAIIAIVVSAIGSIVGVVMIGLMVAVTDDVGGDIGYGVALTLVGPLIALAGAITATAKRRRWT